MVLQLRCHHLAGLLFVIDDQHGKTFEQRWWQRWRLYTHVARDPEFRLLGECDGARQPHDEGRTLAFSATMGGHHAAMRLNQMLDDRQAKPEPSVMARRRSVRLHEWFEHRHEKVR